jgi:6-phospho-3-hexuloisomerase
VLAVTTEPDSPLSVLAADVVVVPDATKLRKAGEAATEQPLGSLFDQCCHVVLDAACLEVSRRRHVSLESSRRQHASE